MNYTFSTWIFLFFIYCFLGWIIESTIVSVSEKRFVNRGFLKGPFLPIYGAGALIILLCTINYSGKIILVFIAGMISATILEYFVSWLMDVTIKIKYWDYSNNMFNIKGRVCLKSSLFWGVLSIVLINLVQPIINKILLTVNHFNLWLIIIVIYFIIDFSYSLYNVINLTKLLSKLTNIKLQIEETYTQLKESNLSYIKNEELRLKEKLSKLKEEYSAFNKNFNFFHIHIIKSYPKATSKYFNDSIKELRATIKKKLKK